MKAISAILQRACVGLRVAPQSNVILVIPAVYMINKIHVFVKDINSVHFHMTS